MKKVGWLLAGVLLASLAACDHRPRNRQVDAAQPDAGSPTVADAGSIEHDAAPTTNDAFVPGVDAFVARDAAVSRDTGAAICGDYPGIGAYDVPPLPATCMPRCTNATLSAIAACPAGDGGACTVNALRADTMPSALMTFSGSFPTEIDCATCYEAQRFYCFSLVCPDETAPYLRCDPETDLDDCDGEWDTLSACLQSLSTANSARLDSCVNSAVLACFST